MKKILCIIALSFVLSSCANVNFNDQPIYKSQIQ